MFGQLKALPCLAKRWRLGSQGRAHTAQCCLADFLKCAVLGFWSLQRAYGDDCSSLSLARRRAQDLKSPNILVDSNWRIKVAVRPHPACTHSMT